MDNVIKFNPHPLSGYSSMKRMVEDQLENIMVGDKNVLQIIQSEKEAAVREFVTALKECKMEGGSDGYTYGFDDHVTIEDIDRLLADRYPTT